VKKVLANTTMYAGLIHSEPQSLKARLGVVGPRDNKGSEENAELP
jgi:soluble lytic murein transglycosylase